MHLVKDSVIANSLKKARKLKIIAKIVHSMRFGGILDHHWYFVISQIVLGTIRTTKEHILDPQNDYKRDFGRSWTLFLEGTMTISEMVVIRTATPKSKHKTY